MIQARKRKASQLCCLESRVPLIWCDIKMERMKGEIRDGEKVMRGLKKTTTPILKGYQICHNFVRPHESLKGDTPADRTGIKVEGENKWITLIQNAKRAKA